MFDGFTNKQEWNNSHLGSQFRRNSKRQGRLSGAWGTRQQQCTTGHFFKADHVTNHPASLTCLFLTHPASGHFVCGTILLQPSSKQDQQLKLHNHHTVKYTGTNIALNVWSETLWTHEDIQRATAIQKNIGDTPQFFQCALGVSCTVRHKSRESMCSGVP